MARSVHRQRPNKSVDRVVNMASSEKDDTVSPTRSLFTPVLLGTSFVFAPDAAPLIIRTTRIAPEILPFAPTYEETIRLKKKEKRKKRQLSGSRHYHFRLIYRSKENEVSFRDFSESSYRNRTSCGEMKL